MKKIICILIVAAFAFGLESCGSEKQTADTSLPVSDGSYSSIDVDLTQLSSTMVYSEVYNMMTAPENYEGKVVKMTGDFALYSDDAQQNYYYACVIADATACCQQGLEFILAGDMKYPDDYPDLNSSITVTGVFETYYEGESRYCHLVNAELSA